MGRGINWMIRMGLARSLVQEDGLIILDLHSTTRTRNCVSRPTFLGLAFKLIEEAENSWNRIRGADKIGLLLSGVTCKDGIQAQDNPPEQQNLAA
jgi:putative transposase